MMHASALQTLRHVIELQLINPAAHYNQFSISKKDNNLRSSASVSAAHMLHYSRIGSHSNNISCRLLVI